ncbi:MAG: AAA family ATPase [Planctomycetota bacterium]|nr:AAA family ATPase [Planctomycetota bacterium]
MAAGKGIVFKYFDLIDAFIRVRVVSPEESAAALQACDGPPSRRAYRRLVVRTCVIGIDEEVLPRIRAIYPEDTVAAEDLLYQICVDVNPALEIHSVALPADASSAASEEARTEALAERARGLQNSLLSEIIGQDDAIEAITRSVRKAAAGLSDPERPIGTFLLVGRTGTGKTELAKALQRHLFPGNPLVRIDCSEFALPHETAKLIGAPPGYVGHNEGGQLTEAMLKDPSAIVLFDEVEKGHEKLHNMLLQILDEGRLTDSKGNTVSFRHALVLLTSNVGTMDYEAAQSRVGFGRDATLAAEDFDAITQEALKRSFKPELLNRLDGVLGFRALLPAHCVRIAELQLTRLAERMKRAGVELRWTPRLKQALAAQGYSEDYGARELRRTLARMVEEPLSLAVLEGSVPRGSVVLARWAAGRVILERKAA